jgi:ParB/RepB/Spo0J family partition protein
MELKINKKLEEVVPKLKEEDYIALRNNIKEKGLLKPIDIMNDGTIIDGHHRFKVCRELGIVPETLVLKNIKTLEDALEYSFNINFARRQLTNFEKVLWYSNIIQLNNEPQEAIAKKLGICQEQLSKVMKVLDNTPKLIIEKIKNERIGWTRVYDFLEAVTDSDKKEELMKEFGECEMDAKDIENLIERCKPEEIEEVEDKEEKKSKKACCPKCPHYNECWRE